MSEQFQKLVAHLTGNAGAAFSGVDVAAQFRPGEDGDADVFRNLNAAFGLALAGEEQAPSFLKAVVSDTSRGAVASFYLRCLELIQDEVRNSGDALTNSIEKAVAAIMSSSRPDVLEALRKVFFPEGLGICEAREEKIHELRQKRRIQIEKPNPSPITDPARELLFTSNVLLTLPLHPEKLDSLVVFLRRSKNASGLCLMSISNIGTTIRYPLAYRPKTMRPFTAYGALTRRWLSKSSGAWLRRTRACAVCFRSR